MTVKEYVKENLNKAGYTIRVNKKNYLCNKFDANSIFGNREVKSVTYKYENEQLPILHLA